MVPIYKYSAENAKDHGEIWDYRDSKRENIKCKEAIEEVIKTHFDGMYLDVKCVKEIFAEFGYDRTMWVLAATIRNEEQRKRMQEEIHRTTGIPMSDIHVNSDGSKYFIGDGGEWNNLSRDGNAFEDNDGNWHNFT